MSMKPLSLRARRAKQSPLAGGLLPEGRNDITYSQEKAWRSSATPINAARVYHGKTVLSRKPHIKIIVRQVTMDIQHLVEQSPSSGTICRVSYSPSTAFLRLISNGGYTTPFSVTIPVISRFGVTSKATLRASASNGATRSP